MWSRKKATEKYKRHSDCHYQFERKHLKIHYNYEIALLWGGQFLFVLSSGELY